MKLPKESQLSREQKEVCYAPSEGTLLVEGPPGSGKTVVALYRRNALAQQNADVTTLVFNHVLRTYTGTELTFLTWISQWWRSMMGERFPKTNNNGRSDFDFGQACRIANERSDAVRKNGHWGHLILDEAQDFSPEAHRLLFLVANVVFGDRSESEKPSLMVLADENQILTDKNSTLVEIRSEHMLSENDIYELRRNYRNTKEIAELASRFYTGLPTGIPDPPESRGDRPRIVATSSLNDAVARIVRHAKLHDSEEIGVLVFYEKTRKKFFNKLSYRLEGSGIKVQTYTSRKSSEHSDATRLVFENGGTISVLCYASSKGLEFDTVFLPELQTLPVDGGRKDQMRMKLYVMTSRARRRLFLMVSDPEGRSDIWGLLPEKQSGLYEFERAN